jgi:hypothetical protein
VHASGRVHADTAVVPFLLCTAFWETFRRCFVLFFSYSLPVCSCLCIPALLYASHFAFCLQCQEDSGRWNLYLVETVWPCSLPLCHPEHCVTCAMPGFCLPLCTFLCRFSAYTYCLACLLVTCLPSTIQTGSLLLEFCVYLFMNIILLLLSSYIYSYMKH